MGWTGLRQYRSALTALIVSAGLAAGTPAFGQSGSTSSLGGVVVDKDGGVVPGATVEVKNNATGEKTVVVTNNTGTYSVPALAIGTYTVSVSLQGFKTWVSDNVRLLAAQSASLKTILEIGALSETVNVKASSDLVQTQKTTVTSTVSSEIIANLPIVSRNTLNFVTFLPNVETTGTARNSTIMGLPQSTINISIDGISNSNPLQSGDGFFSMVTPRLDAIEEVSVTGAGADAGQAGAGAVQIKFVTKSGTNVYKGTAYHYFRHPSFNTNYFFNQVNGLDRNRIIVHQYGASEGGPIVMPGLVDGRGKAFFFFNFEHFHQPTEITRTRTILDPEEQQGIFQYNTSAGVRTVNLLQLAAQNGQLATTDPTIVALLERIRQSTTTTGAINPIANAFNTESFIYQQPSRRNEYAPTTKVDVNLSSRQRLSGSYYWQRFKSNPDILNSAEAPFPGLPNFATQDSFRTTGSITLRSTFGSAMVNEVVGGWQWSPVEFFTNMTTDMFQPQGGFALDFSGITDPFTRRSASPRSTPTWSIDDNFSWLTGKHNLSMGVSFAQVIHTQNSYDLVPSLTFGTDTTNDPARTLFSTAFFPGASNNVLSEARNIYSILTGRVVAVNGTARLNAAGTEYVYLGNLQQRSKMNEMGAYLQDSWRISPTLTLNAGVRWQVILPFTPITSNWTASTLTDLCGPSGAGLAFGGRQCNLFSPGVFNNPGQVPTYVAYNPGDPGFDTKWDNFGPNIGAAWRPNVQEGWLRKVLGDPEQAVVRASFAVAFNRPRMDAFTGLFGGNPGGTSPGGATRSTAASAFPIVPAGESWPVLLREPARLGPPAFQRTPQFPITASLAAGNDINVFDPAIETPYTKSWTAGFARSLGRDMAVEVRYTGNRNEKAWTTENWNTENIFQNGFLEEFERAQANLAANVAGGRGGTFRYFGPGTGTSPLPTYLAFFSGVPFAQSGDAARYTSSNFTNSSFVSHLDPFFADPFDAAADLWSGSSGTFRNNAFAAGVPSNFFVLNPLVDNANITRSAAGSYYHSGTIDLRRRFSRGLLVAVNYTYSRRWGSSLQDLQRERFFLRSTGAPHALKMNWNYQIPVGRGQRFGANMGSWLNAAIGGWEFSGTGRIQVNNFVFRGRLVGMSVDDLHDAFKIRFERDETTGRVQVFSMAQDIIDETRKAFDTDPTSPTGFGAEGAPSGRFLAPAGGPGCNNLFTGDCGEQEFFVNGPKFVRLDMSFKKKFALGGARNVTVQVDLLNALGNINFNHNFNPGGSWQVNSAYTDVNGTFDPGGRLGQLVWRIDW